MKLQVAETAGFCSGVRRAVEMVEEAAREGQPGAPATDPSPSGGDAPQESGSTPSEPPKDTP